jgi:hypothetical protein
VTTPRGVRLVAADGGNCRWSGSDGDYRCQPVRVAAGRTVTVRFEFRTSAGELPSGAADRRSVTVEPISGRDPDRSDNRLVYLIRGDDPESGPSPGGTVR